MCVKGKAGFIIISAKYVHKKEHFSVLERFHAVNFLRTEKSVSQRPLKLILMQVSGRALNRLDNKGLNRNAFSVQTMKGFKGKCR
jgi:hypothetical protein